MEKFLQKLSSQKESLKQTKKLSKAIVKILGIGQILEEQEAQLNELESILKIFCCNFRTPVDVVQITTYLKKMSGFIEIIKRGQNQEEDAFNDLLTEISYFLMCEQYERNSILFRYGDLGDKFYIILKGSVKVLIPKERRIKTSESEYMFYLKTLLKYKEYYLIENLIEANKYFFTPEFKDFVAFYKKEVENFAIQTEALSRRRKSYIIRDINSHRKMPMRKKSTVECLNPFESKYLLKPTEMVSAEEYAKRFVVYNDYTEEESRAGEYDHFLHKVKLVSVIVYEYHPIAFLKTGETFGEAALETENLKRNATIIMSEETFLGILEKEHYSKSIKDINKKFKKQVMNFILGNSLMINVNKYSFSRKYYNAFANLKIERGRKLLLENDEIRALYFIKEGEYDVYIYKSLAELTEFIKLLDKKNECDPLLGKKELLRCNTDPSFKKYYNTKTKIRISIIKGRDILGIDDFFVDGRSAYTVECTSNKGEVFQLESEFFESMKKTFSNIMENKNNLKNMKLNMFFDKLIKIREIKLNSIQNFQISSYPDTIKNLKLFTNNNYQNLANSDFDQSLNFDNFKHPPMLIKNITKNELTSKKIVVVPKINIKPSTLSEEKPKLIKKKIQIYKSGYIHENKDSSVNEQNQNEAAKTDRIKYDENLATISVSTEKTRNSFTKLYQNKIKAINEKQEKGSRNYEKLNLLKFSPIKNLKVSTGTLQEKPDDLNEYEELSARKLTSLNKGKKLISLKLSKISKYENIIDIPPEEPSNNHNSINLSENKKYLKNDSLNAFKIHQQIFHSRNTRNSLPSVVSPLFVNPSHNSLTSISKSQSKNNVAHLINSPSFKSEVYYSIKPSIQHTDSPEIHSYRAKDPLSENKNRENMFSLEKLQKQSINNMDSIDNSHYYSFSKLIEDDKRREKFLKSKEKLKLMKTDHSMFRFISIVK
jgi:CRP-like cAMP-binding protein